MTDIATIKRQLEYAQQDTKRIDFLEHCDPELGFVTLPSACVERAENMREAIDLAMNLRNN